MTVETYKFSGFLTLEPNCQMKLTTNPPKYPSHQARVLELNLELPKALFAPPHLRAVIKVEDKHMADLNVDAAAIAKLLGPIVGAEVMVQVAYTDRAPGPDFVPVEGEG